MRHLMLMIATFDVDNSVGKNPPSALVSWAASWQNQQSDCAPSEDSDPPSLIWVFAMRLMGSQGPKLSSLGAHLICWFCHEAALFSVLLTLLSHCWPKMKKMWASTWQNQQSECAPSEDSDHPGHPPSLLRVFAVRVKKTWVLSYPLSAQRRLIRLGGCPGWSESSLDAYSFCWFCHVAAHVYCSMVLMYEWIRIFEFWHEKW